MTEKETIFMSDSLKGKVDIEKLYDDYQPDFVNVKIQCQAESITRKLVFVEIVDTLYKIKFESQPSDFKFIQETLCHDEEAKIKFLRDDGLSAASGIDSFQVLSKRFCFKDKNNLCTCEIMIRLCNT